jgi:hypothetical protein
VAPTRARQGVPEKKRCRWEIAGAQGQRHATPSSTAELAGARVRWSIGSCSRPRPWGAEGSARSASEGMAPNSADVSHIICYNCGKQGHFQADCKEEPFCVKCNKAGHVSAMCATLKNATEPFWAGYRVDGISFTCCEIQDEELPAPLRTQRSSSWSKGRSQ